MPTDETDLGGSNALIFKKMGQPAHGARAERSNGYQQEAVYRLPAFVSPGMILYSPDKEVNGRSSRPCKPAVDMIPVRLWLKGGPAAHGWVSKTGHSSDAM